MARREIGVLAKELLTRHGIDSPPVQVEDMALAEGIRIIRSAAEWSESGFLLRDSHDVVIGLNSRNSRRRQRFTVAHELGHWCLHTGKPLIVDQSVMINKRNDVSSQATQREEIEANRFAAELLMPSQLIVDVIKRRVGAGVGSRYEFVSLLAKEFDVSSEAMGYRLINLGVISS